jgi:chromosome segregation ATPase
MTDLHLELARSRAQTTAIEQAIAAEEHGRIEAEHRELVPQCREAKAEMDRLRGEADDLRNRAMHLRNETQNAQRHLADQRASKPNPRSYPTEEELEAWQRELSARDAALKAARESEWAAWGAYEVKRRAWQEAKERFDNLAGREASLRSELQPPMHPGGIKIVVTEGNPGTTITRQI